MEGDKNGPVRRDETAPDSWPSASVVICAYTTSRWDQLRAAVRSVVEQDPPADEILVVIDHCPELEAWASETFPALGVQVIANEAAARGLSGARNTGTRHARSDVIVFLDDDAAAEPGWLAGHVAHYLDPDVLGVGGLVTAEWEERSPRWFPLEFGWVVGCSYVGQPVSTAPIRNPIGANMSFRRPVIEAVGGFAESLGRVGAVPVGCEETELAIRAAQAFPAGRILYEPTAGVRHQVPPVRGTWSYFRRRCWAEGRSKAQVRRLSTAPDALSAERVYVRRTLPDGVRRNLLEAGRERDLAHLQRAMAICAGLAITTAGYCAGQLAASRTVRVQLAEVATKRADEKVSGQ